MARLWMETRSDVRKGTGKGASESAAASIFWGSAGDSKLAGRISVYWPKGEDKPHITFTAGEEGNPIPRENVHHGGHFEAREETAN